MFPKKASRLLFVWLALGCSGGDGVSGVDGALGPDGDAAVNSDGGGSDASPTDPDAGDTPLPSYVGSVTLSRTIGLVQGQTYESAGAAASFYDPYVTSGGSTPIALDQCEIAGTGGGGPAPSLNWRDVGAQVVVAPQSGDSIILPRSVNAGGSISYAPEQALPVGAVVYERRYGISWPGGNDMSAKSISLAQGVLMPAALVGTAPAADQPIGSTVNVMWTGAQGLSQELWLTVSGYDSTTQSSVTLSCRVRDDGAHLLPNALVSQLPAGTVSITLSRYQSEAVSVGADEVISLGGSVVYYWQVTKP